ncbi:MAG: LAGLIDADG family homing endonuclease, partial [Candidatus Thorarchaeota archaeon]
SESDMEPEAESDMEGESESDVEPEAIPDFEPESKSEEETNENPEEQWELVTPEGEPITPIEEAIENLYEPEQDSDNEPEVKSAVISEQESDSIPDQEPDLIPEKTPEKAQKKKRIKTKEIELITDPEELGDYKPYEYQHIVKTKYDVYFHEEQPNKPKEKHPKNKKKKPKKIKELKLVTNPEELGKTPNYGESKIIQGEISKSSDKPESKKEKPSKPAQKKKSKKMKDLTLVTNPEELGKAPNYGESKSVRNHTKKSPEKSEVKKESKSVYTKKSEVEGKAKVNDESKAAQGEVSNKSETESEKSKKQSQQQKRVNSKNLEAETESEKKYKEQELREKYRRETGKRPIYNKKETKGFLAWLEKQWEILLKRWFLDANEREISKEIKKELIDLIEKYQSFRDIYLKLNDLLKLSNITKERWEDIEKMLKKLEKISPIELNIFRNLKAFRLLYNRYFMLNMNEILKERENFVNFLGRKLQNLKNVDTMGQKDQKDWINALKKNLYKNTTLSLKEKSQIIRIIQNEEINESNKKIIASILSKLSTKELISLLGRKFEDHTQNYVRWGWDFDQGLIRIIIAEYIKKSDIEHNNRWFTDRIQNYLKNLNHKVRHLFESFLTFPKMGSLFGLNQNYLKEQRYTKNAKNIIAKSILDKMRLNFEKKVQLLISENPELDLLLLKVKVKIISFIDEYEKIFKPLPSPYYQLYRYHPNFKRNYFSIINTKEKAYWLGFLFADGYIGLEHKKSGNYYRMGIGLSVKDINLLKRFCNAVGLEAKFIKINMELCSYTNKETPIAKIRWGDQDFAKTLINLGMEYYTNVQEGKRVKKPKLPRLRSKELMLAFLLGYYDGDGSLGLTLHEGVKKKIFPSIISSDKEFLNQVKQAFNIKYDLYQRIQEKYDFKKNELVISKSYNLYLGSKLFEEMLRNYRKSLKRKRFPLEKLEMYRISYERKWLVEKLPREVLLKIMRFLSPHAIGKILGIDGRTIKSFAEDLYGIMFKSHSHYITIRNSIRWNGKASPFYDDILYWENYLKKRGKPKNPLKNNP